MALTGRVSRRTLRRPGGAETHYFETEILDGDATVEGGVQTFATYDEAIDWLASNGVKLEE